MFSLVYLMLCFYACSFVVYPLFSVVIHISQGEEYNSDRNGKELNNGPKGYAENVVVSK